MVYTSRPRTTIDKTYFYNDHRRMIESSENVDEKGVLFVPSFMVGNNMIEFVFSFINHNANQISILDYKTLSRFS